MACGAGRARKEDRIDPAVALFFHRKVGERVAANEPIATLHARRQEDEALARLRAAVTIGDTAPRALPLIHERIA